MSYQVRFTETNNPSKPAITVADQTVNSQTSVTFVGKNYSGYGQVIAENFLHLLENFSSPTRPTNPVQGQLWFNNNAGVNQLLVYDGTTWNRTGGVSKSDSRPTDPIKGDLWVDTTNQQLSLYSGTTWILIGPQYSSGLKTGPEIEIFKDLFDENNTVITFWVSNTRTIIISSTSFTPKVTIDGFKSIHQGINLSTSANFDEIAYWGIAEKASALVIDGVTVASTNFLRSDQDDTTDYGLGVRNSLKGISIGDDLSFVLAKNNNNATVTNKVGGASIDFIVANVVNSTSTAKTVVRIDSSTNVGINKLNPTEALDVTGNIQTSGKITVLGTTDATSFDLASIVTTGGAAVGKKLLVGDDLSVNGQIYVNYVDGSNTPITGAAILPASAAASGKYDIGTSQRVFGNVYAENFYGQFNGIFAGTLSGTTVSGSASKLTSPALWTVAGDVVSSDGGVSYNGQTSNGTVVLNTRLSPDFINNKTIATEIFNDDEVLINRSAGGVGIKKTTVSTLLSGVASMPIGAILPYAGPVAPVGYLLCDGSEVSVNIYNELFGIVGFRYKDQSLLTGYATFALPDLRGRFPLGRDSMDNNLTMYSKSSGGTDRPETIDAGGGMANRVTSPAADEIGLGTGTESKSIELENLPEHNHNILVTMPD